MRPGRPRPRAGSAAGAAGAARPRGRPRPPRPVTVSGAPRSASATAPVGPRAVAGSLASGRRLCSGLGRRRGFHGPPLPRSSCVDVEVAGGVSPGVVATAGGAGGSRYCPSDIDVAGRPPADAVRSRQLTCRSAGPGGRRRGRWPGGRRREQLTGGPLRRSRAAGSWPTVRSSSVDPGSDVDLARGSPGTTSGTATCTVAGLVTHCVSCGGLSVMRTAMRSSVGCRAPPLRVHAKSTIGLRASPRRSRTARRTGRWPGSTVRAGRVPAHLASSRGPAADRRRASASRRRASGRRR